ncbi:GNAT family N-acetyltransferase [Streptomyces sp. BBFR2]|uniref:GNAT family N-acetyltransferase n=1 Tax=Streptomyces sp. BBFR2 TaxID=3372854 RepID=UPI0037DA456D
MELFCRLPYSLNDELADDLAEGRRKPSWMWVALHGDRVLARVAWWSRPGDAVPALLDIFDLDDTAPGPDGSGAGAVGPDPFDAGLRLLRAALPVVLPDGARPEYLRSVAPAWRADRVERRAVENRMAALERTGARLFVERLRWEWTPQDAGAPQAVERDGAGPREGERDALGPQGPGHGTVPPRGPGQDAPVASGVARQDLPVTSDAAVRRGRPASPGAVSAAALSFRSPRDREELLALMTSVLEGTLDAHSRAALGRMSAREAAVQQYEEELVRYRSPREWWRVGVLPGGEPVGFVIPAHNGYHAIIAYLGVVPAYRGNGYADALLAEGTRVLAGQGVPRVRANTDLGNVPMADAFRRAGYRAVGGRIDMTWE